MSAIANRIDETPHQLIKLRDGCCLSARIWKPESAAHQPVPAILEYLPYRKRDGTTARDALTHPYFAARGYACLRVDMRGNGDSEGLMEDEYTPQELNDAVEVINWIAAQPWCTGNVGMMGISWGGFNSLQVAALQPAPLKAIITLCSTDDRYRDDIHYKGGCLLNENLGWGATMLAYSSRPPDPQLVGEAWQSLWLERLQNQPFLAAHWLGHQTRDSYWRHGSVCEDYSAITAATLAVGGWGDAYKNAVPRLVANLNAPVKGIIGPWVHKYPHFAVPEPRIGFLQEAVSWWDRWLKEVDNGAEALPALRAYVMDSVAPKRAYEFRSGRWIVEADVPSGRIGRQRLHLAASRRLTAAAGEPFSDLVSSPADCGLDGGEYCAIWLGPELAGDQRTDDGKSVCFDSDPLAEDVDVVGAATIAVRMLPVADRGQIAVRLCDVFPDGSSYRITYGVLNLTHRQSHGDPSPLTPGEEIVVELALDDIAYRVPSGHRLRIAISSAYWPLIWPAAGDCGFVITGGHADLPIRDTASEDEWRFDPPTAAPPWETEQLRPSANQRTVTHDHATGEVTLMIVDDFGKLRDSDHGLITGSMARERWTIHPDDPLSARGQTHWTTEFERPGVEVRTETYSTMRSDLTNFYLTARIEAWQDDALVFERDFSETVPRNLV